MFLNKKIEWFVLIIYTLINMWIVSFFIFDEGLIYGAAIAHVGNSNLFAIFIGLFFNTGLILYTKIITNRKIEGILLLIYSYLNIKTAFPFLSREELEFITMSNNSYGSTHNLLAIFIGLFLNVILIIYWARRKVE